MGGDSYILIHFCFVAEQSRWKGASVSVLVSGPFGASVGDWGEYLL